MDISKAKLNFTQACRWISPSDQGGVAMHNGYLMEALKGHFNLEVISLNNSLNNGYYTNKGIVLKGIEIASFEILHRLARTPFLRNGIRSLQDYYISKAMANALDYSNSDVIEFMDIHSEAYIYLKKHSKSNRKTKVVIRAHTPWTLLKETYLSEEIKGVNGWWSTQREQYCFDACDVITTPSEDLKKQLIRIYNLHESKITVIPNLLDTEHFKPIDLKKEADRFTFLHVGRFERAKGVITLTKAFIKLAKEFPMVKLINIGQPRGNAYAICLALLKEANILERVEFTGFIDYEALPGWYAKADAVAVTPEIYESFSYTAAQAMACGKLVILSDSGGMPETAGYGKYGRLYKKGDADDLYEAMKETMANKNFDVTPIVKHATESFGLKKLGETYLNFYNNLKH